MSALRLPALRMGLQTLCLLLLVTLATWKVAETQPAVIIDSVKLTVSPGQHVRSGTNVILQCTPKITSGTGMTLTHQYTFYRDSTVVYTKNTTTARSLSYPIPQARVANSGSYKCSISVHGNYRESNSESLNVTGLQTPTLRLNKTVVTEGEEVTAFCHAPLEIGTFYFYFFEGSKELKKVHAFTNEVKAELKFSLLGRKSLHCEYVIDLQPGSMRSSKSRIVDVYVRELLIKPTIEIFPRNNVIEGDTLNITCDVSSSHHGPSEIMVHLSKGTELKKSGRGSLVFTKKVLSIDSGEYECKSAKGNVVKSVSSTVEVSELFSVPVLKMEPQEVFEKESFSLSCYSHNISSQRIRRSDVKYSLYHNGRILNPGDFAGKFDANADISLNGNYRCSAAANIVHKSSNVIVFKAKVLVSKPLISVPGNVIVGRPFQIHCHSENGSLPISYTLLNNKLPQHRQPNDTAFFTVTIKKKEDIKNFTCTAENNGHSSKKESVALNVTVIEPVSSPSLLIIPDHREVTEGDELHLSCKVVLGSPLITFKWYRQGSDEPLHTKVSKERFASFMLGRASGKDGGTYHCMADNAANQAVSSNKVTINVSMARWKKILIGASCIVLLVIFIGVGCYFYRSKRDSDVQSSEEEPKEPDVQYTEVVHPQAADGTRGPMKKGTDTVYSELQNSPQGVADQSGYQGSVEYAQLNHDLPQPV